MNIKPFGKNILIKPVKEKDILVTDTPQFSEYGEVVAIGPEVQQIKVGDTIGHTIWGIQKLMVNEEAYYFVPETDSFILCTLDVQE